MGERGVAMLPDGDLKHPTLLGVDEVYFLYRSPKVGRLSIKACGAVGYNLNIANNIYIYIYINL
jgi:hypothetical protein